MAETGRVALVCKSDIEEANTFYAQGGVASVTNLRVDNFDKHIEDTMIAGDWLSDRAAVEKVVKGAPEQINQLLKWGVDSTARKTVSSTCTARADTRSSASCTTPTTPAPKSSRVSCAPSKVTPTSTCLRISSPLKS